MAKVIDATYRFLANRRPPFQGTFTEQSAYDGVPKEELIAGYRFRNGELVCVECSTDFEDNHAEQGEILMESQTENAQFVCRGCE